MRAKLGVIVAALIVPALAGCQGKTAAATAEPSATLASVAATTPTISPTVSSPPAVSSPSATLASAQSGSGVPSARSPLPDGVYRSHIGDALVSSSGADPGAGDTGTWTLTVKDGTYRLACAPISNPGGDCGNDGADSLQTVELGTLRGQGSTVWFVHDQAALSRLTGCVIGTQADNGCGPDGGYHAKWTLHGHSLTFSDFVGLGDEAGESPVNEETVQPWTRIS
jgi:hypothetical protein